MKRIIADERVLLDGQTLTVTFRSDRPFFACDLNALDGGAVRTMPLLALGASHSGSLKLGNLPPGIYGLAVRWSGGAEPFGRLIAEERAGMARAIRGSAVGGNASKIATSAFAAADGERHAALYADLPAGELRLRIATDDDIDAFLAPWSSEASGLAPIRFSLVAPTHNVEKYLNEFIASLTGQSLDFRAHAELIFVDDGSTDGSARIIKSWQRRYPDNIRYVYQENAGISAARNLGLSMARHDWVSFPDPDDFVDRDYFAAVADAIDRHREDDLALIACYMVRYYEAASRVSDTMPLRFRFAEGEKLLPANNLGRHIHGYCNGAFFRRDLIEAAGLRFDPRVRPTFEDGHFVGRLILAVGSASVLFLPGARYYYRRRSDRSSIMDKARGDADWYGDALRHGHLDLLKTAQKAHGSVSLQVQNSVLHALSFRLQEIADNPDEAGFLDAEQRERYHEILGEIFSYIDATTIMGYDIVEIPFWHRVGMLNLFKGVDPPWQQVEVTDFEPGTGMARFLHWSRSSAPVARYSVDGAVLPVCDETRRRRLFTGALFVWEHAQRVMLPADGTLTVTVGEVAARIVVPENVTSDGAPISHIRRAFVGRISGGEAAARIDAELWSGFSGPAARDLAALHGDRGAFLGDRLAAAFGKARFHAAAGRHEEALDWITRMHGLTGGRVTSIQSVLLEATCLIRLDRRGEARLLLEREMVPRAELDADLCLAYQSCFADDPGADDIRLDWINRVFEASNIHPIAKRDPAKPLAIGNLAAPTAPKIALPRAPKVSVIMPVHNAEATVAMAIDSVLAQTWRNLELIIVDDHSTDATWDVVRAAADKAPIVALRQDSNRGAYVCRNRGLEFATGDLITTHDSDDWSHPQRIEAQVRYMMERPGLQGTRSFWCRVAENLSTMVAEPPGDRMIAVNYSSFLFTRRLREQLGCWDEVRVSADHEFIRRATSVVDYLAFAGVATGVPLAFGLRHPGSLTQRPDTHIRSFRYGVRRDYDEAAGRWYRRATGAGGLRLVPGQQRAFPAPARILPDPPPRAPYDTLFVFDFADPQPGGAFAAVEAAIHASNADRRRVAVFLWRDYGLCHSADVRAHKDQASIVDLVDAGKIDLVSPGDAVDARTVIVGHPALLKYAIDDPPRVRCDHVALLACQPAWRYAGDREAVYDPGEIAAAATAIFGKVPVWVPVSPTMRRVMAADGRYAPIHDTPWLPLLDLAALTAAPIAWRGGDGRRPLVGRISRDGAARWPSTPKALRAATCADRRCDVRILGGAATALRMLGRAPANWLVLEAGAVAPSAFLRPLDFLVHHPHEDLVEAFSMSAALAMAAGKPVILPPSFEETFGPAAVYAAPDAVWPTIRALWKDEHAYLAQARAGRDFAVHNLSHHRFAEQLATLEGELAVGVAAAG